MKEIVEFFTGLFATDKWPERWHCGEWSSFHGWLYIISDLMIWLAYFMIPLIILKYFTGKKGLIKYSRVYLLFAAFILLCGSTHFIDALMFWIPMYRLNALVRLATGIVSLVTVYQLIKILPQAFKQKTNLELEKEIAKRQEAEKKLSEANASLEAFAYIASHDLQEPLRKIRTFTSMLHHNNAHHFDEASKKTSEKIEAACARMQGMISDVLKLSTLNSNINFKPVQLMDALQIAIDDLEIKIQETGAVINIGFMPVVQGNKEYLSQLFANLLSNAIKFTRSSPVIDISSTQTADAVTIYVKDNGIGMEPTSTDKIFLAFQRLHSRSEFEGSGIGLAICKRITALHGGSINVQSIKGEGTTFIIHLPLTS